MSKMKIVILGDASSAKKAFGDVGNSSQSMAGKLKGALGSIGKAGALAAGAAGVGAIAVTLKTGFDEWKESTMVAAQTEAVLKSTGNAANTSAKQIDYLSNALMRKSGVDDEAIKSGQNMLLTFTNIRNAADHSSMVFDDATTTLLDMSVALNHGDVSAEAMSKQAIQLGKALNDPIKGVTALARVGVTFTEGQKKTIASLVKHGKTMEAQKLILRELNKEFGGSAEALGKTLPGRINIAKQEFNNLAGTLFAKLVPALTRVIEGLIRFIDWLQSPEVAAAVRKFVDNIKKELQPAVDWVRVHWPEIKRVVETVGRALVLEVKMHWAYIKGTIRAALSTIQGIIDVVMGLIHGDWSRVWKGIREIVSGAMGQIKTILAAQVKVLGAIASRIGHAIWDGLKAGATETLNFVIGTINSIIRAFNSLPFVPNIPTIPTVGGSPASGSSPVFHGQGPAGAPRSPSGILPRGGNTGASVTFQPGAVVVHGTADAAFAKVLANELATQIRGGRVPAFQQAVQAV